MLIAEHFFLVACDPRTGLLSWPRREQDAGVLVAAAILVDLAVRERVHLHDGRLRADSQMPLNHPLLSEAMELLAGKNATVAEAMDLITRLPEEMWNQDLRSLGTTRARAVELAKLNGSAGRERAVELLREYHAFAIAPFANELRGMALADIDRRSHELASGGISELFAHLHPDLRLGPEGLLVEGDHGVDRLPKRLLDGGLVLVPSVFVWPGVATYLLNGFAPTVAYAAIGVGNFVRREGRHSKPLSDLLGATRARILLELELPMTTTQVVGLLRLAPATANAHLKTLADSGLATAYRDGRAVVYRPTALGDSLASQP